MFSKDSLQDEGLSWEPYFVKKGQVLGLPIVHYNLEFAVEVALAIQHLKPDAIAIELPETMASEMLHAASRLPDVSVVVAKSQDKAPLYYLCEPCDALFEALRAGIDNNIRTFCIDLDIDEYPNVREYLPDTYAIKRIGLKAYYEAYLNSQQNKVELELDLKREVHMAKKLKELTFSFEKILFIGGMAHLEGVFAHLDDVSYPQHMHAFREHVEICTLTENSVREVLAECGWVSSYYEKWRDSKEKLMFQEPDRQAVIYSLCKMASIRYSDNTGNEFPGYHMRNIMKFMRNYALVCDKLQPDLFQILSAAKACVDNNYAYEVWELATHYPYYSNVDNLRQLNLTIEDFWQNSKLFKFTLKQKKQERCWLS